MDCIFIDYTSAYNSVNRKILFEILKKNEILPPNELDFLNYL